jgi:hypothetical protein
MSSADPRISNCRHCQHYQLQGRRGGMCQKLNVAVRSDWSACSLSLPAFANPLDLEPIERPQIMVPTTAAIPHDLVSIDTFLESMAALETAAARSGMPRAMATSDSAD